ncbi:DoxX family protein [Pseudomonas shirazensis]
MENIETNDFQKFSRVILGLFMITAAIGHFTFQRIEYQAQVPSWITMDKNFVVIISGIVDLVLGLALIFLANYRVRMGIVLAVFFVLILPGNIEQYLNHTNALSMNTDQLRLARLLFQPILIFWSLWSTGALSYLLDEKEYRFQ